MDITGLQTLEEVIQKLAKRGVAVVLCEANTRVRGKLKKAGLLSLVGERYFDTLAAALGHSRDVLATGPETVK